MRSLILAVPLVILALAAPAGAANGVAKRLAQRVAGTPQTCVQRSLLRYADVIDHHSIVYTASNGTRLYVNEPIAGLPDLDDGDVLVMRSSSSQVCENDIVDLVDRYTQEPRGFVRLGRFVPYDRRGS